mmetsp:Transcript_11362/g.16980  ORF Transcript_11362/g.16980 Transcript_11362/m.16980 type:complete len:265 (+) Transcript_11362:54-848(+)
MDSLVLESTIRTLLLTILLAFSLLISTSLTGAKRTLSRAVIIFEIPTCILYNLGLIFGMIEPYFTIIRKIRWAAAFLHSKAVTDVILVENEYKGVPALMAIPHFSYFYCGIQLFDILTLMRETFWETKIEKTSVRGIIIQETVQAIYLFIFLIIPFMGCFLQHALRQGNGDGMTEAEGNAGNRHGISSKKKAIAFVVADFIIVLAIVVGMTQKLLNADLNADQYTQEGTYTANPMTVHFVEATMPIVEAAACIFMFYTDESANT